MVCQERKGAGIQLYASFMEKPVSRAYTTTAMIARLLLYHIRSASDTKFCCVQVYAKLCLTCTAWNLLLESSGFQTMQPSWHGVKKYPLSLFCAVLDCWSWTFAASLGTLLKMFGDAWAGGVDYCSCHRAWQSCAFQGLWYQTASVQWLRRWRIWNALTAEGQPTTQHADCHVFRCGPPGWRKLVPWYPDVKFYPQGGTI